MQARWRNFKTMRTALFPGSFDPFTRGHQAVVEQALRLFDRVVIAIGENVGKRSLLSLEARRQLISDLYRNQPQVECVTYSTLTGDIAREVGAAAIVRGVRNAIDFEYERTMAQTNSRLFPDVETVLLMTPPAMANVSSSTVRELLVFGREVDWLLPEGVNIQEYME